MPIWNTDIIFLDPGLDEMGEVEGFLAKFNLYLEETLDQTVLLMRQGKIIGTGSLEGNILKCIAIDPAYQGEGLLNSLMTILIDLVHRNGKERIFLYAEQEKVKQFRSLGFRELVRAGDYPVLLENSLKGIEDFQKELVERVKKKVGTIDFTNLEIGSMVMNCNPITKGHLYLIKKAAQENDLLLLFILSEDRSLFPPQVRYQLVRDAISSLDHVLLCQSGPYILSYATFPSYFLGPSQERERIEKFATVDAKLFGKYMGKYLKIKRRYVGNEPYSKQTRIYNQVLKKVLPDYGIDLIEVKRKEWAGQPISASRVRHFLWEGKWSELYSLVPKSTYDYLQNNEKEICQRLKRGDNGETEKNW